MRAIEVLESQLEAEARAAYGRVVVVAHSTKPWETLTEADRDWWRLWVLKPLAYIEPHR